MQRKDKGKGAMPRKKTGEEKVHEIYIKEKNQNIIIKI